MLDPSRLHVTHIGGASPDEPLAGRRYTLTHSDRTGHLYLSIGLDFDRTALSSLQVRLERDEVLGEWFLGEGRPFLELTMMAQGGFPVFGTGAMRCEIFRHYRPMVLDAMRYGDRALARAHPEVEAALVIARFVWRRKEQREDWGTFGGCSKAPCAEEPY